MYVKFKKLLSWLQKFYMHINVLVLSESKIIVIVSILPSNVLQWIK